MRKTMKAALPLLLTLSLFVAPVALGGEEDGTGQSLIEWIQDTLEGLLELGPVADPAG